MAAIEVVADTALLLPNGWHVPLRAWQLLLDLERREFEIAEDDGMLTVKPKSKITATDDAAIRRDRDALLTLVRYFSEAGQ